MDIPIEHSDLFRLYIHTGVEAHDVEVDRDDLLATGPLDLDRHHVSVGDQTRLEHLRGTYSASVTTSR